MRAARIYADEQLRLIMECHASGLTNHEWCMMVYAKQHPSRYFL